MGEHLLEIYLAGVTTLCLGFLSLSLTNRIAFRRLTHRPRRISSPKVSVLVPARNEQDDLGPCLDSLLDQDYGNYEILVLDDNSTDRTREILDSYARTRSKLSALSGKRLPKGWLGKPYACQQLSEKADGEYLLFTDADTVHKPNSVSWAVTNMMDHDAAFMSAYPRQRIGSFGEAVIVPGIFVATALFLPVWLIPRTRRPSISFAIGQFVISRADALRSIGGFEKVKDCVVDDIFMARNMKAAGFKTLFLDAAEYVDCRMYRGYRNAFSGIVRSLYAALDKRPFRLLALFLLIAVAVGLPVLNLAYRAATGGDHLLLSAVPVAVFFTMWLLVMVDRKLAPAVSLLYPLLFLNLMAMAVVSAAKTGYGNGVTWKGRRVR